MDKEVVNPLVSIVTPSFNSGKYVEETITSVLSQGIENFEHIIYDGLSTDNSTKIFGKYPHLDWVSEKDNGQSDALNKALKKARGKYIGWINADDFYNEGFLKSAVNFLEANPEIDLVYSDLELVDENSKKIGHRQGESFDLARFVCEKNMVKQASILMKRDILSDVGYLREDLHYVMDREFWLRIALAGYRFGYLDGTSYASFRITDENKTSLSPISFLKEWKAIILEYRDNGKLDEISAKDFEAALSRNSELLFFAKFRELRKVSLAKSLALLGDAEGLGFAIHNPRSFLSILLRP